MKERRTIPVLGALPREYEHDLGSRLRREHRLGETRGLAIKDVGYNGVRLPQQGASTPTEGTSHALEIPIGGEALERIAYSARGAR